MKRSYTLVIFWLIFFLVLIINGALPFVMMPTLGQAVGTTIGWAQAFINEGLLSIHSHSFGYPHPAARSFGLAGVLVTSVFMRLGLEGADAYSAMVAFFLFVAYYGAYRIGEISGRHTYEALLLSALWLCMPVVWAHAGYSMLSIGIALLPFYYYTYLILQKAEDQSRYQRILVVLLYIGTCVLSVFMDGYTFVMFQAAVFISYAVNAILKRKSYGLVQQISVLLVLVLGVALAYYLYKVYVGQVTYAPSPISFFRGWGADVTFFILPPKGQLLFWDAVNISVKRDPSELFGDSSVWKTTFIIPLLIIAIVSVFMSKWRFSSAWPIVMVMLFGFYMSLGPSLKINSHRSADIERKTMLEEEAITSTGSAILSENFPGFKNMRASYRWSAIGALGLWLLVAMRTPHTGRKKKDLYFNVLLIAAIVMFVPNSNRISTYKNIREAFFRLKNDLLEAFKQDVTEGEVAAVLPYRNDLLINYLSSGARIRTYNIGGDKNLAEARKHWPETMKAFSMAKIDNGFASRVLTLLSRDEADAVVLPYIDMLWAAHQWPYPIEYRDDLLPVEQELEQSGYVDLVMREFYSVVRLKPRYLSLAENGELEALVGKNLLLPPYGLQKKSFSSSTPTKTGRIENGRLATSGNKGFLLFGPYVKVNAGRYLLEVYGYGTAGSSAWSDVVSQYGKTVHAQFRVVPDERGRVVAGEVVLEQDVDNLEIRVYAGEEDKLVLTGYQLVPVGEARENEDKAAENLH